MPLNVSTIRTPAAADADATKVKFTLSAAARERLRKASEISGHTMSNLMEMLIMQELVLPGETPSDPPQAAPGITDYDAEDEENFIG